MATVAAMYESLRLAGSAILNPLSILHDVDDVDGCVLAELFEG